MLYISWMIILGDHNIKKKQVSKTSISELVTAKNYTGKLCTNPLRDPPPPPPHPIPK